MIKKVLIYGLGLASLVITLKMLEFSHVMNRINNRFFLGAVASLFLLLGTWVGIKFSKKNQQEESIPVDTEEVRKDLGISTREFEVLHGISEGLTNSQIAEKLFLSESTIKTHSSNLFSKLGVNRRTQAMQKARELGLII